MASVSIVRAQDSFLFEQCDHTLWKGGNNGESVAGYAIMESPTTMLLDLDGSEVQIRPGLERGILE